MNYLIPEQVLFIHARLVDETGGEHGLRDLSMLLSALARPRATFDGQELYPTTFLKASALLESLLQNHPFLDGNKRTGITSAAMFLLINGFQLTTENDALADFTFRVVLEHPELDKITKWFEGNSKKPNNI